MQNCPKCGASVDEMATVCPSCGEQIESTPKPLDAGENAIKPKKKRSPAPPSPLRSRKPELDTSPDKRPTFVTIIIILLAIGGAFLIYYSLPFLIGASQGGVTVTATITLQNTTSTASSSTFTSSTAAISTTATSNSTSVEVTHYSASLLATVGLPYVVAGLASFLAAYGFYGRKKWAFRVALVVNVFGLLQSFIFIDDLYNLLIGVAVLYLQTRPLVRAWLKGIQAVSISVPATT